MQPVITDTQAKNYIAENVTRLLHARGWTQQQLADATKENKMMISRVCRGEHVPGAGLLGRIAEALETTMDALASKPK